VGRDRPPALFWQARGAKQSTSHNKDEDERQKFSPSRGWIYIARSIRQIFQRVSPRELKRVATSPASMNNLSEGSFRGCTRRGLA